MIARIQYHTRSVILGLSESSWYIAPMPEELCYSDCPFFRYQIVEVAGLPPLMNVFCKFHKNGEKPMLSVSDEKQIAFLLAQMARYEVVFDDVECIAPRVWKKED